MMKHFLTLSLLAIFQIGWTQSEYCLDGTVWDATLGGCIPESYCLLASDLDGDGVVGAGDLLLLLTEFGGSFPDADADGICDDNDDCVGVVDECGVCNGPGPTFAIIESIEILYDSVYAEQIDQWLVFEVGADTTFSYTCEPVEPVTCDVIPSETSGPFPLDLSDNTFFHRQEIQEDREGVRLRQRLRIVGAGNCEPMANLRVHVWHCDRDGDYSGYAAMNTEGQTYCRGYQLTDANGECEFVTIVPGWYPGRVTHMHLYVYVNPSYSVHSQYTWPHDSLVAAVESNPDLYPAGPDPLTPASDGAFADGYDLQMASLEWDEVAGEYVSTFEATIQSGLGILSDSIND